LKKLVGEGPIGGTTHVKVKEPHSYDGMRSEKELDNFLWDMDKY